MAKHKKKAKEKEKAEKKEQNQEQPHQETSATETNEAPAAAKAEAAASEMKNEVEQLKERLNEAEDKFVRSRADLENYRKRAQRETAEARQAAKVGTVEQFLPVFDHFQMAMHHVGENSDFETLKQGMDMILNEFSRTFETLGVKQIDATGQKFDPNIHEAMAQEPSSEIPAGQVLRQWKCGYRLGERLLRPATVVVSSGPEDESQSQGEEDQETKA